MKISVNTSRLVLLIPLLWLLTSASVWSSQKKKLRHREMSNKPVATLGTPEASIEVFRLTSTENPKWTYMIVRSDEDGTHRAYGDEQTVGRLLENLSGELRTNSGFAGRCPAASGWRFESAFVKSSYCTLTPEAQNIERAVQLLETAPQE